MKDQTLNHHTENALHAAQTWLQRIGADPDAVAVVTTHPVAAVHVWRQGADHLTTLPGIDDAGADLCEAVAPLVADALSHLDADQLEAVHLALKSRSKLQLLLVPAAGGISLRLVAQGGFVVLASLEAGSAPGASCNTLH